MVWRTIRSQAVAALLAATCLAAPAFAQAPEPAPTLQNAQPANRLALVIGEAGYVGVPLQTAANDAALVAKTLGGAGFDVSELHDLNTPDLASGYQAFLAKVQAAPPGAAVTVYLAGLAVNVGCDDYLLPVDAQIKAASDVPAISLSMTKVMSDLAQTSSQVRIVMLDGARPIPESVSAVTFPRGLIPLDPPGATTFGLSAEVHDFEAPPKPGDADDAYAVAFVGAAQQPFVDVEFDDAPGSRRRSPSDRRRTDALACDEPDYAAVLVRLECGPGAGAGIERELAERRRPARRLGPRSRLLGGNLAQHDRRLPELPRRVRGESLARSNRARPQSARASPAAQPHLRSASDRAAGRRTVVP